MSKKSRKNKQEIRQIIISAVCIVIVVALVLTSLISIF